MLVLMTIGIYLYSILS